MGKLIKKSRVPMLLVVALASVVVAGCGGKSKIKDPNQGAASLYSRAAKSMHSGNWPNAIAALELLEGRYPFADQTKQAQIDLMYAYYKNSEPDAAVDAAETFILENPTHPRVDYANYIKGLVFFPTPVSGLNRLFRVDMTERPPNDAQRSFENFHYLVSNFPQSPYAANARQRMIFLRNYIAAYEIHVADFYMSRGAYVAALRRAENVLVNFEETPSVLDSLELMVDAYQNMGLDQMAQQTARVLTYNKTRLASKEPQPVDIAAATPDATPPRLATDD